MIMRTRSSQLELIDLGPEFYTLEEYEECLDYLGKIGKVLGGNRATLQLFRNLKESPTSILDVGCGGGHFTCELAQLYPHTNILGIDLSKEAIDYARKQAKKMNLSNVSFEVPMDKELKYADKSFDIVTCTLVCHHMLDAEIIEFLKRSQRVAKKSIIINDLHRHGLAYFCFALVAPVLFPNRLILNDGLISVKKGFTKTNWISYLSKAGLNKVNYEISWKWAFRWLIQINL